MACRLPAGNTSAARRGRVQPRDKRCQADVPAGLVSLEVVSLLAKLAEYGRAGG